MKHEDHMSRPGGERAPGAEPWEGMLYVLTAVAILALLALAPFLARL